MEFLDHLVLSRREEKEEKTRLKSFERETDSRFQRRQDLLQLFSFQEGQQQIAERKRRQDLMH